MTTERVIRHADGSVTVERELMRGVVVGATDPLGSEWHAHRAAYAEEVRLRERIAHVGVTRALSEVWPSPRYVGPAKDLTGQVRS